MNGDRDLKRVFDHIETYNREMGQVKTDIAWIKSYIKKAVNRLPVWATMLIGLLMGIIGWLIHTL